MQTITRRAPEGAMRRVCPEMYATRLFLLCCMMYIIGVFGRMSYSAVAVELITSEGFTKSQAGLIGTALFAAYGACQILSGLPWGQDPAAEDGGLPGCLAPRCSISAWALRTIIGECSCCGRQTVCSSPSSGRRCSKCFPRFCRPVTASVRARTRRQPTQSPRC